MRVAELVVVICVVSVWCPCVCGDRVRLSVCVGWVGRVDVLSSMRTKGVWFWLCGLGGGGGGACTVVVKVVVPIG